MTLGEQFSKYLKSMLMSKFDGNVSEMARYFKIHRTQIDRYLDQKSTPNLSTIDDWAKILKVSPYELLGMQKFFDEQQTIKAPVPSLESIQKDVAAIKLAILGLDQKADECKQNIQSILPKT